MSASEENEISIDISKTPMIMMQVEKKAPLSHRPSDRILPLPWWLCSLLLCIPAVFSYFLLDKTVATALIHPNSEMVRAFFRPLGNLGQGQWFLLPGALGVLFFWKRNRKLAWYFLYLFFAVLSTGVAVNILKALFGRMRPDLYFTDDLYGFSPFQTDTHFLSMPSGHATTAAAAAVVLGAVFPRYRWMFYLLGLLLAFSRIATTAHFISDVLIGIWLGMTGAFILGKLMLESEKHHET